MGQQKLVSIIVRTFNEEKWIGYCLESIFSQSYKNFEVIIVDNNSTDRTIEKAKQYPVAQYVNIDEYLPGKSLNIGIRASKGDYLCFISAHCIPVDKDWLGNLVRNLDEDNNAAGVYGRQEPMSFTPDTDKRDLLTIFGLDKKIQKKDSYFHNANSLIHRSLWEETPFDEEITNIEDRIWAREMIKQGKSLIYEPEASVYHHHGVHQNQNPERCRNVVRILESLHQEEGKPFKAFNLETSNIVAIIPVRGPVIEFMGKSLLARAIESLKSSKLIKRIIVSTDNEAHAKIARENGAEVPFLRDDSLSKEFVDIEHVYKYTLEKLEESNIIPDIVVTARVTYPFRPTELVDELIKRHSEEGLDSVIPARAEYASSWKKNENSQFERIDEGFVPRIYKQPTYIGLEGLACVTFPHLLREGHLIGNKVGIYEINNSTCSIEVRDEQSSKAAEQFFL